MSFLCLLERCKTSECLNACVSAIEKLLVLVYLRLFGTDRSIGTSKTDVGLEHIYGGGDLG